MVNYRFFVYETITIGIAMKFYTTLSVQLFSSPKLKNFIFGGTKGAFLGLSWGFGKSKPSPSESL